MLGNPWFYRETTNRLAVAFMSLFKGIWIAKQNADGTIAKSVEVPILYGPRQKWLGRLLGNPDLTKGVGITLPRMGAEMIGLNYAPDRKLSSTNMIRTSANTNIGTVYVPVPVDIGWRLSIMTNTTDDANQIIEQIIPFFTPEWVNRVRLVDENDGLDFNMPVTFTGASMVDNYGDGDMNERRILIWELGFTMQAYMIGPARTSSVIKIAKVDITDLNTEGQYANVQVQPGMTANGQPTSNASISVNPLTINVGDNWGYVVEVQESD